MEPIGYIESCYKDKFGTPRQPGLVAKSWARLKIRGDLQPEQALEGLEGFSHIWLIWIFHQNKVARYHAKVHPPRLEGESIGLFATRTPHRPNPIGLSLVELVKVEKDCVIVAGADLVDGTPVLDIKPYLPDVESVPSAKTGWTGEVKKAAIEVRFSAEAEVLLRRWDERFPERHLRDLIVDTLRLDPRPVLYRGYESTESPYRETHAVRLYEGDVHFRFSSPAEVEVFDIRFTHN